MDRADLERYLKMLGEEIQKQGTVGEICLAGGAVMLLAIQNREMTKDIDAYFGSNPSIIRKAARKIAIQENLPDDWINDGVKGFFYGNPPQSLWAEFPGLKIYMVSPEYLFAMKASAGRNEDIPDLKALIKYLNLTDSNKALDIVERFIPHRLLTPHTRYLIEDLFDN